MTWPMQLAKQERLHLRSKTPAVWVVGKEKPTRFQRLGAASCCPQLLILQLGLSPSTSKILA